MRPLRNRSEANGTTHTVYGWRNYFSFSRGCGGVKQPDFHSTALRTIAHQAFDRWYAQQVRVLYTVFYLGLQLLHIEAAYDGIKSKYHREFFNGFQINVRRVPQHVGCRHFSEPIRDIVSNRVELRILHFQFYDSPVTNVRSGALMRVMLPSCYIN